MASEAVVLIGRGQGDVAQPGRFERAPHLEERIWAHLEFGDAIECDLLVVFENDVLIFSDKDISFPTSSDVHKDWSRWFRRAVVKSAAQLRGAERWRHALWSRS